MASAGAVGTIVAETSHSEDQSTPTDVVLDAPAENANSEANHDSIVAEPEPRKAVFADLPEKVSFVDLLFFSSLTSGDSKFLTALNILKSYADVGPS